MIKAEKRYLHSDITDKIISCAYEVYDQPGFGFSEKVYENSMMIKLAQGGLRAAQQVPVNVYFDGRLVGEYFADILVEDKIIIELKSVTALAKAHEVPLVNYRKATGITVGLLINSGEKLAFKRRIVSPVQ